MPRGMENDPTIRTLCDDDVAWNRALCLLYDFQKSVTVENSDLAILYLLMFSHTVFNVTKKCHSREQLDRLQRNIIKTVNSAISVIVEDTDERRKEIADGENYQ